MKQEEYKKHNVQMVSIVEDLKLSPPYLRQGSDPNHQSCNQSNLPGDVNPTGILPFPHLV